MRWGGLVVRCPPGCGKVRNRKTRNRYEIDTKSYDFDPLFPGVALWSGAFRAVARSVIGKHEIVTKSLRNRTISTPSSLGWRCGPVPSGLWQGLESENTKSSRNRYEIVRFRNDFVTISCFPIPDLATARRAPDHNATPGKRGSKSYDFVTIS